MSTSSLVVAAFSAIAFFAIGCEEQVPPAASTAGVIEYDPLAAASIAPEKAVVLSVRHWSSVSISSREGGTELAEKLDVGGRTRFVVKEAKRLHRWECSLPAPIDPNRFPIAVMTYRASNIGIGSDYTLSVRYTDGDRSRAYNILRSNELVPDGKAHTVRKDLRETDCDGPFESVRLKIACLKVPAEFELLDMRFEADPAAGTPAPPAEGKPIDVYVGASPSRAPRSPWTPSA